MVLPCLVKFTVKIRHYKTLDCRVELLKVLVPKAGNRRCEYSYLYLETASLCGLPSFTLKVVSPLASASQMQGFIA